MCGSSLNHLKQLSSVASERNLGYDNDSGGKGPFPPVEPFFTSQVLSRGRSSEAATYRKVA
jgi:hypothetical protein